MNINLHIERLVLDGLPLNPGQGREIQVVLERELSRLLRENGMGNVTGGAQPHLSAGPIQLSSDGGPVQWGRQIARTLYGGLTPAPAISFQANRLVGPTATSTGKPTGTLGEKASEL